MGYAVVLGEALIDLLEGTLGDAWVYRPAIGGGPLNVAVGVARLGGEVQFVGAVGDDPMGNRIADFLRGVGVGTAGVRRVGVPSALALATFDDAEPTFRFYGEPPSYSLLGPDDLDTVMLHGAAILYAGSISLLREPFRSAARVAWQSAGGIRVFDPNVRPLLLPDAAAVARLREVVQEFCANADLVKLSSADASVLFDAASPTDAAAQIRSMGARTVVVTCGERGAYIVTADGATMLPAPMVAAVDATGAGDSVMGALIRRLLTDGLPDDLAGWQREVSFALAVAGLVCERAGGAVAMPTMDEVTARWGTRPDVLGPLP